ncbi:MAG TPA: ABC transporter permease [Vicinamibacterales bacterium]
MSLWRQLARGLRALIHQDDVDRDIGDEVQHYFDEATAARLAAGMSPADARRAARLDLGSMTSAREQLRSAGWERAIETGLLDVRYALRRLRASPAFTIVSAITLGLGVGATTAIFSAVNPILFEPLPYPDAGRLVTIWYRGADGSRADQAFGTYREVAQRSHLLAHVAVMKPWRPTLLALGEAERLDAQHVSAAYFRTLGAVPALGRDFDPADDGLNAPRTVVLSDALWRRRFAADRGILGRQITLDDEAFTVVGVMPRSFENVLAPSAELWSPLRYDMSLGTAWGHHLRMIGRVRPGIPIQQATQELETIARHSIPEFPRVRWASLDRGFIVSSLYDDVTGSVRPGLLAALGAVILVLVVACVNVTNLLLARATERRGELAMRAALGASPGRLVRQMLTESVLLAILGGALGVAAAGLQALIALGPADMPRALAIGLDREVFAFALAVSAITGLLVGVIPAIHGARSSLYAGLQDSSRRAAGHQLTRRSLVVAEIALAFVLLVSAGLLLRSLQQLFAIDPGFDGSRVLTMQVQVSPRKFDKDAAERFFGQALDAVRDVPDVAAAAWTSQLPLSGDDDEYGAHFEEDEAAVGYNVFRYAVTPDYFETIGIPLKRGRLLDSRDRTGAPPSAVLSESLARRKFGALDPLGRRVHLGPTDRPSYTIVGVVGDVKQASLAADSPDAVYISPAQSWFVDSALSLVVRARDEDAAALAAAVKAAIRSIDGGQPILRVATMNDLLARTAAQRRFALTLFEAFGLVALVLAATGIYGVLAGSVTERTREIGVRTALGASRASILGLIGGQGLALSAVGVALGCVGAAAASRLLVTLLFGVTRLDPVTYIGVVALVLAVSAVACALPAWRAARVDPCVTLRAD